MSEIAVRVLSTPSSTASSTLPLTTPVPSGGLSSLLDKFLSWLRWARQSHPKKSAVCALVLAYWLYRRLRRPHRKSVENKIVLITGGASGLGKNLARRFASLGARVVLWDINERALHSVGKQIAQEGGLCWTFQCDITNRSVVYKTADRVFREVGRVDILINNAGIVSGDWIVDIPDQRIEKTFEVNVISHFWTIKAFLPEMIKSNSGHIVTIASAAGLAGAPKLTDYCASKASAFMLDESLRNELRRRGHDIKTTCVCPYYIDTGMFDGARTRFSWLLPILSEDYASSRILNAILNNEPFIAMPALVYSTWLLRFLLPTSVLDWVSDFLGVTASMDHFRGRAPASQSALGAPSSSAAAPPASQSSPSAK